MVFGGILTAGLQNTVLAGCEVAWACKPREFLPATSQPMVSPRGQPSHCFRPATLDSSINNWPRNVKQTHCLLVGNHGGLRHSNCGFAKLSFSWVWGGITLTIHTGFSASISQPIAFPWRNYPKKFPWRAAPEQYNGSPELLECHDGMCFHTFKTHGGEHTLKNCCIWFCEFLFATHQGYGHVVRDEPVLARASMASHFTVRCSAWVRGNT